MADNSSMDNKDTKEQGPEFETDTEQEAGFSQQQAPNMNTNFQLGNDFQLGSEFQPREPQLGGEQPQPTQDHPNQPVHQQHPDTSHTSVSVEKEYNVQWEKSQQFDQEQMAPPQDTDPKEPTAGFCGKIPAHGDFVSRNLPDEFLTPWNQWTQTVIGASQEQLENLWLETYLTSPIWRFAASPGACCANGFCGIMIPSVDKVGRYFPFTMIELTDDEPLNIMRNGTQWFTAAQQVMLRGLEEDISIESLLANAANLPSLAQIEQVKTSQSQRNYSIETPHHSRMTLSLPLDNVQDTTVMMPGIVQVLIKRLFPQHSIWWTEGSERIPPTMLICEGMPPISGFSAMLDGDWDRWGWPREQVARI